MQKSGNIFEGRPEAPIGEEAFEVLHGQKGITIERIFSDGQVTPEGQWYDQERDEWVLLLQGQGELLYDDGTHHLLQAGDYLLIPRHQKHRVIHTDPGTLWLAVHMQM